MATVSKSPAVSKPADSARDFYYVHTRTDKHSTRYDVSGNTFDPHFELGVDRHSVKRKRFAPLPTESRFRLCILNWEHTGPDKPHGFHYLPDDDRKRWYDNLAEDEADRLPVSYVDLPPAFANQCDEVYDEERPLLTRAEGLAAVAEHNRDTHEQFGEPGWPGPEWAVLLEYAPHVPIATFSSISLDASGVGVDDRHTSHPVRVVTPTAEELAKYAIGGEA